MTRRYWFLVAATAFGCDGATPTGEPPTADDPAHAGTDIRMVSLSTGLPAPTAALTVPWTLTPTGPSLRLQAPGAEAWSFETRGLGAALRSTRNEGAVEIQHPDDVTERWTLTPDGAEQEWRFAHAPREGAVALEVSVGGLDFQRADAQGLWFVASDGRDVRYSRATWIDATGRRTDIEPRWNGRAIALAVPGSVLAGSTFPAVLDPTVTTRITPGPAAGWTPSTTGASRAATVAVPGGVMFLGTVERNDLPPWIVAARRGPNGEPTAESPHAVLPGTEINAAAYATGVWVVTSGSAARVGFDGRPLDVNPVPVPASSWGSIACLPTRCLAVWASGSAVLATRLSDDGRVLDPTPITVTTTASSSFGPPSVVAVGGQFVVGWTLSPSSLSSNVRVTRVTVDGTVLDPSGVFVPAPAAEQQGVQLATDGVNVLAVWNAARASGPGLAGTYAALLDPNGAVVRSPVILPRAPSSYVLTRTRWDGARWLVFSYGEFVRLDRGGNLLDAAAVPFPRTQTGDSFLSLGALPDGLIVANQRPPGVVLTRYNTSTAITADHPVDLGDRAQPSAPRVTSDGRSFLVGWPYGFNQVSLVEVSATGVVSGAPTTTMLTPGFTVYAVEPILDDTVVQVFSSEGYSGATHRVAPRRPTLRLPTMGTSLEPSNGAGLSVRGPNQRLFVFASTNNRQSGYVWRYSSTGMALDPAPIALPQMYTIAGAFDGTRYLVVYRELVSPRLFSLRFGVDGTFLDPAPRALTGFEAGSGGPGVAFGGGVHLAVWVDAARQVRAGRVGPDGAPLAGTPLVLGTRAANPAVAPGDYGHDVQVSFDGTRFAVVWLDGRDQLLRCVHVSPAGAALESAPIVLNAPQTAPPSVRFGVASTASGQTLVVFNDVERDRITQKISGVLLTGDGPVLGSDAGVPDAGALDVGPADTGVRDAGFPDVGFPDVGLMDAGVRDTGPGDSGVQDVGPADTGARDAGPPDTGARDVGLPDVGFPDVTLVDAGSTDAGVIVDVPSDVVGDERGGEDVSVTQDTGTPDAVVTTDVAMPPSDAGPITPEVDAGAADVVDAGAPPPPEPSGGICDVAGVPGATPPVGRALFVGVALLLAGARRRRGTPPFPERTRAR